MDNKTDSRKPFNSLPKDIQEKITSLLIKSFEDDCNEDFSNYVVNCFDGNKPGIELGTCIMIGRATIISKGPK